MCRQLRRMAVFRRDDQQGTSKPPPGWWQYGPSSLPFSPIAADPAQQICDTALKDAWVLQLFDPRVR